MGQLCAGGACPVKLNIEVARCGGKTRHVAAWLGGNINIRPHKFINVEVVCVA